MSTANEYFSCKGTRLLRELKLVVEFNLSFIVESKRNFICHTRAILIALSLSYRHRCMTCVTVGRVSAGFSVLLGYVSIVEESHETGWGKLHFL